MVSQSYQVPTVMYDPTEKGIIFPRTIVDCNRQGAITSSKRRAARYVANNHRNRSSVSNIIQRLKWRPHADRRKDARLVMLYKIDRELVAINKENRLIPTGRKTRKSLNRSFQIPSSRIDSRKMSFFPRTVRDWNLLAPDLVELDTPEAFKARIVSL